MLEQCSLRSYVDSQEQGYDGWDSAKNPDGAVVMTKYGYDSSEVAMAVQGVQCNGFTTMKECGAQATCSWGHWGCVARH